MKKKYKGLSIREGRDSISIDGDDLVNFLKQKGVPIPTGKPPVDFITYTGFKSPSYKGGVAYAFDKEVFYEIIRISNMSKPQASSELSSEGLMPSGQQNLKIQLLRHYTEKNSWNRW